MYGPCEKSTKRAIRKVLTFPFVSVTAISFCHPPAATFDPTRNILNGPRVLVRARRFPKTDNKQRWCTIIVRSTVGFLWKIARSEYARNA